MLENVARSQSLPVWTWAAGLLAIIGALLGPPSGARAVNIRIDYEYDANFFFSHGNPGGQAAGEQARAAVEAAAAYFSVVLQDTLAAIQAPPPFTSAAGTSVAWGWNMEFRHPATNAESSRPGGFLAADEYRIYVGAQDFTDNTLAIGSSGTAAPYALGTVKPADQNQVNQLDSAFKSLVQRRGEPAGFVSWGGAISFARQPDAPWNYSIDGPVPGANDFYSVAIHEMAHALGFGTSQEWSTLASGSTFIGQAAAAAYGGVAPPLALAAGEDPDRSHWRADVMSTVFGTSLVQQAAMTQQLTIGTRKRLTAVDAGVLIDIGWELAPPAFHPADFNADAAVNAADFDVWKSAFGATLAANADGDGDTDGADFLAWQRARGQVHPIAANPMSVVPEPLAGVMFAWVGFVAARWRRRLQRRLAA